MTSVFLVVVLLFELRVGGQLELLDERGQGRHHPTFAVGYIILLGIDRKYIYPLHHEDLKNSIMP